MPSPELLEGRYQVGELIGRGGMADVHSGTDLRLHRAVAIKLLPHSPAADRERFAAEAHMLAQLSHPNLVRVFDAGGDDHVAWLIMELVRGKTMADRCREAPLTDRQATEAGRQLGDALAYVHREGVVHRDVKPSNILFDDQGRCLLADFGVARLVDQASLTATGTTVGTPAYLAPEQAAGEAVGPPADIYSLGLVLAEALSGKRVFEGSAAEAAAARVVRDPELPDGLSPEWRLLLRSMTRRDPDARPTAAELTELLDERLGMTRPMSAVPPDAATNSAPDKAASTLVLSATDHLPPADVTPALRPSHDAGRSRYALLPAVLLSALALAVGFAIAALLGIGLAPAAHHASTTTIHRSTTGSIASSTTSTSTTTTTTSPTSVSSSAGAFVSAVETALENHDLGASTAQAIDTPVTQLLTQYSGLSGTQIGQQLQQVAQSIGADVQQGEIVGPAVTAIESSLSQVAHTLGYTTALSFAAPKPGGGHGHGHGPGNISGH